MNKSVKFNNFPLALNRREPYSSRLPAMIKPDTIIPRFAFARLMRANVAANLKEKRLAAALRASLADYFYNRSYKVRQ